MTTYVVDASVIVKFILPEEGWQTAHKLLSPDNIFYAPDWAHAEIGNVLWKKVMRKELKQSEAYTALSTLELLPLNLVPVANLMVVALQFSIILKCTFYDSIYLALAQETKCPFLTADVRLFNAVGGSKFAHSILLLNMLG